MFRDIKHKKLHFIAYPLTLAFGILVGLQVPFNEIINENGSRKHQGEEKDHHYYLQYPKLTYEEAFRLEVRSIYSLIDANKFEKAYSLLLQCKNYEISHNIQIGPEEGTSCWNDEKWIIQYMLDEERGGLNEILFSSEFSYEEKMEIIDRIIKIVKRQHEKE
jgi:hypothetical protein